MRSLFISVFHKFRPFFFGHQKTRSWLTLLFGEESAGGFQYRLKPVLGLAWGGPMNGQRYRANMVAEVVSKLGPMALVETGTYLGTTTDWLAGFQIPIYSCEASAFNFGFSSARLEHWPHVSLFFGDSRHALACWINGSLADNLSEPLFFYLDAHWNEDLPLAEELSIIFSSCHSAVVLIDDFEVPDDNGYTYDDYGSGRSLTYDYIDPAIKMYDLAAFCPVAPASVETGAKRGCIILCKSQSTSFEILNSLSSLKNAT